MLYHKKSSWIVFVLLLVVGGLYIYNSFSELSNRKEELQEELQKSEREQKTLSKRVQKLKKLTDSLSEETTTVTIYDTVTGKPIKKTEWKTRTKVKKVTEKKTVHDTVYISKVDTIYKRKKQKIETKETKFRVSAGYCLDTRLKAKPKFRLTYSPEILYFTVEKQNLKNWRGFSAGAGVEINF